MPPAGYPIYPQGGVPGYPYPYGAYPGPAYPGYFMMPPPVKRDTYRLTIGIISIVLLSITLLGGGLFALILGLGAVIGTLNNSLASLSLLLFLSSMALIGGSFGLYFAIRALMERPSAQVRLPSAWVPLGLTVVVLGAGIVQHDAGLPQAPAPLEALLLMLSGILPALTILAFTSQRLGNPSTWRRVWMSFLSGTFLATLLATITELIAGGFLVALLHVDAVNIQQLNSGNPNQILAVFLLASVVAPLAEEGFKPVGPLTMIGRIRSQAEAFLLGMAAGMGFAIFETIGYIGQGGADWILVAMERVGAGLVHGVGAGMATLGWFYLIRGRGITNRYAKGIGCIAYAVLQHGIYNGSTFLALIPGPLGDLLNSPIWFFGLPEQGAIVIPLAIYAGILVVLIRVTGALRSAPPPAEKPAPAPIPAPLMMPAAPMPSGGAQ
jgi:RsiW-degrading membrane proteinase PrsW (M82 family)